MTITRTLERLERFGDSDADRALRPPVEAGSPGGPGGPGGPGVPGVEPRPRGRWLKRALVGVAALVVVAVVVTWLVAFSPLLGASTVQVLGTSTLSDDQVRTAAGVADGTPLVRLDTAAVARRVEALPQVASARVDVEYPSTVTVTVVERVPVLRLTDPTRLVDASGDAYLELPAGATLPRGLPVTGATGDDLRIAAGVAAAVPLSVRIALVGRIDVDAHGPGVPPTVQLALVDGRTVVWGDPSRNREKGALTGTLFGPGAPDVSCTTMDLSSPDQVVCR
ncbi:cell division protein FtsQ/DivIB [Jatrophihabitans sp. YIM 134969]